MLDSLFQEKRNKAKEYAIQNERRIEAIKEKMYSSSFAGGGDNRGGLFNDEGRVIDYIQKNELQFKEQLKKEAQDEERKKKDKQMRELETKAFLDMQVQAKHNKKELERANDQRHAKVVYEDVRNFEMSTKQMKDQRERKAKDNLEDIKRQIDEQHMNKHKPQGMAPQEFMINKRLIDEVERKSPPASPVHVKRPF